MKNVISELTLEEKASLCSGKDFWHTEAVERLHIPDIMVSDGPHGLRKQDMEGDHLGIHDSIKAVCFPAGCALASSFDRDLAYVMGEALGEECKAEKISVLLGPAINIKRSPLCGRNFEYYSEDPYLTGEIASSYVNGVQSQNVGTSVKHYLASSQEYRRMTSSSVVDERTMREIYMPGFETTVKKAQPFTVMCSYNKINGEYVSDSKRYLSDILRDEWGFKGLVVSDWGAVNDRVEGLKAGMDLEMPSSNGINDKQIIRAVEEGRLKPQVLDQAVNRILQLIQKTVPSNHTVKEWNREAHHNLARRISSECMVLLKNEQVLPLDKKDEIAWIGEFATKPRYQGGGSSHINSFKTSSAWDCVKDYENASYAKGYDSLADDIDMELIQEAVMKAKKADVAVVFAGLPDSYESEGYDRKHMRLPENQNRLIEAISEVQPNIVVVLHNGAPVEMPWVSKVKGILEVYLGGQAVGEATVDVLFGDVNPSGRLAETFPVKLSDNPSYLYYGGEKDRVEYREGVFVGYRYYDKKGMEVLFPFGHGLSYTTFVYSNMKLDRVNMKDTEKLEIDVDVTNTGNVAGKEVVQLYVQMPDQKVIRPLQELKGFTKISLKPGETKQVHFTLDKRSFSYFNAETQNWCVISGQYEVAVGASSRDLRLKKSIEVISTEKKPSSFTPNSTFGDLLEIEGAAEIIAPLLAALGSLNSSSGGDDEEGAISSKMLEAMLRDMPLRGAISFGDGSMNHENLREILEQLNQLGNEPR